MLRRTARQAARQAARRAERRVARPARPGWLSDWKMLAMARSCSGVSVKVLSKDHTTRGC